MPRTWWPSKLSFSLSYIWLFTLEPRHKHARTDTHTFTCSHAPSQGWETLVYQILKIRHRSIVASRILQHKPITILLNLVIALKFGPTWKSTVMYSMHCAGWTRWWRGSGWNRALSWCRCSPPAALMWRRPSGLAFNPSPSSSPPVTPRPRRPIRAARSENFPRL